jgi:glycosyltransferase involved in cell wall biosynthesis
VRILIVTDVPRDWEAGTAAVLLNHAKELQKLGHDVDCWFRADVLDKPAWPRRFETVIFSIRVARSILRARDKYDVVEIHVPLGFVYGAHRKLFGRKGTPPYVFTMQGIIERHALVMRREHSKGRAWHFGWKNRLWHRFYLQTLHYFAIKMADYGVASNREAWTYPELKYDCDPGRLWYVPNGADERFFTTREYERSETIRLLYVGTWLDRKGIYYLADAFQSLIRRRLSIELTIAGCLCEEQEVKRFFTPDSWSKVRVLPFVKRESMPEIYANHDVFVFPSLMEGMPLVLLEAMASGMPVVTTEICGMADVVEHNVNGLLVPPANSERLVEATERLCESVELRSRIGREAQRTMRCYTWPHVVRKLEMVLSLAAQQGLNR